MPARSAPTPAPGLRDTADAVPVRRLPGGGRGLETCMNSPPGRSYPCVVRRRALVTRDQAQES